MTSSKRNLSRRLNALEDDAEDDMDPVERWRAFIEEHTSDPEDDP